MSSSSSGMKQLTSGRRWNVLRHRTDSHAFEVDTLFLGTLLFTVTAFLAPTVLAYGLLFALVSNGTAGYVSSKLTADLLRHFHRSAHPIPRCCRHQLLPRLPTCQLLPSLPKHPW